MSWLTWPLRWSTTPVKPFRPFTIWATCCCLPWVMVARDRIIGLSAPASDFEKRLPASFWMS